MFINIFRNFSKQISSSYALIKIHKIILKIVKLNNDCNKNKLIDDLISFIAV
jgi:hypothetical protein